MPWKPSEAKKHTRKAKSAKAERQWADVANSVLAKTGDDGRAIRAANAVIARRKARGAKSDAARKGATDFAHRVGRP